MSARTEALWKEHQDLMENWNKGGASQKAWERMEEIRGEFRQTVFDEKLGAGDVEGALAHCGSEEVAGVIVQLAPALTDEQLRGVLTDEWTRCEAHRPYRADFVRLFKQVGFVTDVGDEWSNIKTLPKRLTGKTVTIYRGNLGEDEPDGIAWTLSKKTAQFFGDHHMSPRAKMILGTWREDGVPTVWSAKVDTKDILAYFHGRGEQEVVVDPATLRNVKRIQGAA